jgi:hypothetical protein
VKRALNTLYETLHGPDKLVYGQSRNVHTFVFMFVVKKNAYIDNGIELSEDEKGDEAT